MRLALLFLLLSGWIEARSPARMALSPAQRLKTDDQIALWQGRVQREPRNPQHRLALAKSYIQKVRESADFSYLDRASQLVERIVSEGNAAYEAMRLRSEIELERHNFLAVAEYSEELTRIEPRDPWNWGTLGDARMELGQYDGARDAYARMVTLRPDLSSFNRMAYYLFVTGKPEQAFDAMRKAIAAGSPAPENVAWCLADLGNMYFKTGKLDAAEEAYRNALDRFPGYYPAYAGLGRAAAARGNDPQAITYFKKAYATLPLPEYAAALYCLHQRGGHPEEARKYLALIDVVDQMARANGETTDRSLALIYANLNRKLDRARQLVEAELAVRPDVYSQDALAWVLYRQGEYGAAAEASRKALSRSTPEPAFFFHAARIATALARKEEARQHWVKLESLNPGFDILLAGEGLEHRR
ncbi:MAG: tetratricopeptide repeat protein [Bryobacteraceae bacterium]